ncbi:hypothetical protein [Marinobacter sp. VGCF2001]|uniref:hypothetical protein n=1 Tax=Marinobacter sp. VGCF2001 TaxID=3417189 RepID=UPI003CF81B71
MMFIRLIKIASATLLLSISATAAGGWLNPHFDIYPQCTPPVSLTHHGLLELTQGGKLFLAIATAKSDGMDSILARRHGFQGFIFDQDIMNHGYPLPAGPIRFTGTMVRRDASIPERVLGGSRGDSFYYVVALKSGEYLLHPGSFDHSDLPVCDALLKEWDGEQR